MIQYGERPSYGPAEGWKGRDAEVPAKSPPASLHLQRLLSHNSIKCAQTEHSQGLCKVSFGAKCHFGRDFTCSPRRAVAEPSTEGSASQPR
jgi:hypothetical protein